MSKNLTSQQVESDLDPGLYGDGDNLYLRVSRPPKDEAKRAKWKGSSKSWVFIFRLNDRQHEVGLGKAGKGRVTLAQARAKAAEGRKLLDATPKVDPRSVWRAKPAEKPATFGEAADALLIRQDERLSAGKNPKHRSQWRKSLGDLPKWFRNMPVAEVGPEDVFKVLDPRWTVTPQSASRLRGRIAKVLDSARGPKDTHANPAAWSGWLKEQLGEIKLLGKRDRKTGERIDLDNFAAMPYAEIPSFVQRLRAETSLCASALEFLILTATRSGETRDARWSEIDFAAKTWTIPWQRLKTGIKTKKPHVVPLADRALEILEEMRAIESGSDFVFPGRYSSGKSLSEPSLLHFIRVRMGEAEATVHGFRSAFRDWVGNETSFQGHIAEQALAHIVTGVEGRYRRDDGFVRRVELMSAWAAYCASTSAGEAPNVVSFARAS
jgi:integrase